MAINLIELTRKTQGRGSREIKYQGLDPKAAVDPKNDAKPTSTELIAGITQLLGGDESELQERLVKLYNRIAFDSAADTDLFAEFDFAGLDEKQVKAFKRMSRQVAEFSNREVIDVARELYAARKK